jgi:hypothetical protein
MNELREEFWKSAKGHIEEMHEVVFNALVMCGESLETLDNAADSGLREYKAQIEMGEPKYIAHEYARAAVIRSVDSVTENFFPKTD